MIKNRFLVSLNTYKTIKLDRRQNDIKSGKLFEPP